MNDDPSDRLLRRRAKAMMRKRFRGHRKALPPAAVAERSQLICERLLAGPWLKDSPRVALFWPLRRQREVDLRAVDTTLRERGCRLAYPRVNGEDGSMQFLQLDDPQQLVEGPMGLREPPADAPLADVLDVLLVPGLAFDDHGRRIGFGAGFYDRALPRWCPPAVKIGVAFDVQLAVDLPHEDHDVAVDWIVTDRRVIEAGA